MNEYVKARADILRVELGTNTSNKSITLVYAAAEYLFDNRLGESVAASGPYAPREFWANLGEALYGAEDPRVRSLRGETPKTDAAADALRKHHGSADSTLDMQAIDVDGDEQ